MAEEPPNEQFDVDVLMNERFPPYVVQCLLTAGFDTAEVISSMDSCENPGNSISAIESFIDKYYPGNKEFRCSPAPVVQHSFIFPPGHRFCISNFIAEVKLKY